MKKKMAKTLAVLMCLMTAVAFMPTFAFAADGEEPAAEPAAEPVTVEEQVNQQEEPAIKVQEAVTEESIEADVSISNQGEVVLNKTVEVTDINENGHFDIDDTLYCAHKENYPGGVDEGYGRNNHPLYGLSVSKLWGVKTERVGYYVNNKSAWNLADEVNNGDYVSAFVYKDQSACSDQYTWFSDETYLGTAGESVCIKLMAAGYDENWTPIDVSCEGAEVTVKKDGAEVKTVTNAKGVAEFDGLEAGDYTVTAKSTTTTYIVPPAPSTLKISAKPAEDTMEKLYADRKAAINNLKYDVSKYRVAEQVKLLSLAVGTIAEINAASGKAAIDTIVTDFNKSVASLNTDQQYKNVEYYTKSGMKLTKATKGKKKATIKWNKNTRFGSYQIYYKKSGNKEQYTTASVTSASKTLTKLTKKKQYTFKIRGCKTLPNDKEKYGSYAGKTVYGAWSNAKTIKIK